MNKLQWSHFVEKYTAKPSSIKKVSLAYRKIMDKKTHTAYIHV